MGDCICGELVARSCATCTITTCLHMGGRYSWGRCRLGGGFRGQDLCTAGRSFSIVSAKCGEPFMAVSVCSSIRVGASAVDGPDHTLCKP